MKSIVVVGAQWGDEGKGKVVDYLAASFDYIARCAGGHLRWACQAQPDEPTTGAYKVPTRLARCRSKSFMKSGGAGEHTVNREPESSR